MVHLCIVYIWLESHLCMLEIVQGLCKGAELIERFGCNLSGECTVRSGSKEVKLSFVQLLLVSPRKTV